MRRTTLLLAALLSCAWMGEAFADPPAHAPAHGWRKKHDPYYVGYAGTRWERDYEISSGRCNREEIGAVIGGVAGGVIGSRAGENRGSNRTVATIIGAAVGALIGAKIGREMDESDRGCVGHGLELAKAGQRVYWHNDGLRYELVAGDGKRSSRGLCREFTLSVSGEPGRERRKGLACQNQPGVWKVVAA